MLFLFLWALSRRKVNNCGKEERKCCYYWLVFYLQRPRAVHLLRLVQNKMDGGGGWLQMIFSSLVNITMEATPERRTGTEKTVSILMIEAAGFPRTTTMVNANVLHSIPSACPTIANTCRSCRFWAACAYAADFFNKTRKA